MDADVKTVLSNIHEQASLQRTSMAGARDKAIAVVTSDSGASMKDKAKEQEKKHIADGKDRGGGDKKMDTDVSQGICYHDTQHCYKVFISQIPRSQTVVELSHNSNLASYIAKLLIVFSSIMLVTLQGEQKT
jgi:hypothetical protein